MIDHFTLRVSDIETTKSFYEKALAPLGYRLEFDNVYDGVRVLGFFTKDGKMDTWFTSAKPVSGPSHIGWTAASKEEVDAFYNAAISAGWKDNGPPGPRAEYSPDYYWAFVLDPDGNNMEAVFHW